MRKIIYQQISYIDNLFDSIKDIDDDELKSHWAKYLCILTSGLIENTLKFLIEEYLKNTSAPNVRNYVRINLQNITNLKYGKITNFLECFSADWKTKFESIIKEKEVAALDSIITNRNNIVHGQNVGLSYSYMKKYYDEIKNVLTILELVILN